MRQLLIAFQFLTILPVRVTSPLAEEEIARSSWAFTLVGLSQGLLLIAVDYAAGTLFHPDLVAVILVVVLVLTNGGFHLDGLADTFDALAVKSSGDEERDRRKRLAIMKDSTTGPMGVAAIVFVVLLKYLSLKSVAHLIPFTYYSSLLLMPVLSKWTAVISLYHGRPARNEGLGSLFMKRIGIKEVGLCTLILLVFLTLPVLLLPRYASANQHLFYGLVLVITYGWCHLWIRLSNRKFGGLTGDTIGAVSELTEILFLLLVLAWSQLSI